MSGSTFGKVFKITTWGESHGPAIGVVVDGCPAGLPLCEDDIQRELDRRKPGASPFTTRRNEPDQVNILSGVFTGRTTGTPLSMLIHNTDHRSADYSSISQAYRPGHADYTYDAKYGFRDYRGGGRSSGRETAARVAAGAVSKAFLTALGIHVNAYSCAIGSVVIDKNKIDLVEAYKNPLVMPDREAYEEAAKIVEQAIAEKDSLGGVVECMVDGLKPGIGEPVFDKLDAILGQAIFSIGGVKAVEFGTGFAASAMTGSAHNDSLYIDNDKMKKVTNHAGGIYGGISDGSELILRAAFKPTPSIGQTQHTVNADGQNVDINIKGRHDPLIVPRAVVVVEAMTAITLTDYILLGLLSKMDHIQKLYQNM